MLVGIPLSVGVSGSVHVITVRDCEVEVVSMRDSWSLVMGGGKRPGEIESIFIMCSHIIC